MLRGILAVVCWQHRAAPQEPNVYRKRDSVKCFRCVNAFEGIGRCVLAAPGPLRRSRNVYRKRTQSESKLQRSEMYASDGHRRHHAPLELITLSVANSMNIGGPYGTLGTGQRRHPAPPELIMLLVADSINMVSLRDFGHRPASTSRSSGAENSIGSLKSINMDVPTGLWAPARASPRHPAPPRATPHVIERLKSLTLTALLP